MRNLKTVYVDTVFFTNFAVDYIILYLCFSFLHLKVKFIKLLLSSTVGSIFSVICAVTSPNEILKITLSFVTAFVMVYIVLGRQRVRTYIKAVVSIYTFSVLLGGTVMLLCRNEVFDISFFVLMASGCFLLGACRVLGNTFKNASTMRHVEATFNICGSEYDLRLLCDSGNVLTDPYTSLPVIIINRKSISCVVEEGIRYVPYATVSGSGIMKVISPEKTQIKSDRHRIDVSAVIGFCENINGDFMGFDGIIPQSLCEYI